MHLNLDTDLFGDILLMVMTFAAPYHHISMPNPHPNQTDPKLPLQFVPLKASRPSWFLDPTHIVECQHHMPQRRTVPEC